MAKKKVKSKRLGGPVREAVEQDDLQEATKYEAVPILQYLESLNAKAVQS